MSRAIDVEGTINVRYWMATESEFVENGRSLVSGGRTQIQLDPAVLRWARERAHMSVDALSRKVGVNDSTITAWEESGKITVSQINNLSRATYTPLGFLYLPTPPNDELPIQDFRTHRNAEFRSPSPNLLDTVFDMQRRQMWMRDELLFEEAGPLPFVGSATINSDPQTVAWDIRATFELLIGWASNVPTWTEALRFLRDRIEASGVLVVINGVVGNNTHRKLDVNEFRGFAISDEYAPLIFINGSDAKSAQMFTLAHECAHLWLGTSGVSSLERLLPGNSAVEQWCNRVAAEFLVPEAEFSDVWKRQPSNTRLEATARHFKVSQIVIARRALDFGLISRHDYDSIYDRSKSAQAASDGGNFWNTQNVRIGRRFGAAVVQAVKEGRLLYTEAYRLTGLNIDTFSAYAEKMGYS